MPQKNCPNCGSRLAKNALNRCTKCNCKIPASTTAVNANFIKTKASKQIILNPKFCSSCGSKTAKEALACPSCGQPFIQNNVHVDPDEGFWIFLLIFIVFLLIIW